MSVYLGQLLGIGLMKEGSPGVYNAPVAEPNSGHIRPQLPWPTLPELPKIYSSAVGYAVEMPQKGVPGPKTAKAKLNLDMEPSVVLGHLLMAIHGAYSTADNGNGTYTHTFTRKQGSNLPQYSMGMKYQGGNPAYLGMMCNTAKIAWDAKGLVKVETDWLGQGFSDSEASWSYSPSLLSPIHFAQVDTKLGGLSDVDLTITAGSIEWNNKVVAEHTAQSLTNGWPAVVFSSGGEAKITLQMIYEGSETEIAKYLAGTASSMATTFGFADIITGSITYQLVVTVGNISFDTYTREMPDGAVRVQLTATALPVSGARAISTAFRDGQVNGIY